MLRSVTVASMCLAASASPPMGQKTFEIAPGVHMPAVLLGTGYMPPTNCTPAPQCEATWINATVQPLVKAWLASGARGIDTANMYMSQPGIALAIKDSGVPREEIFILTKIPGVMSYEKATEALQQNVDQLGGAPLDAVISHWCADGSAKPTPCNYDDMRETWRAMEDFHKAGKARAIGVSNYCVKDMDTLMANATIKPMLHQIERNPYFKQEAMEKYCAEHGIHLQHYAPLNDADRQSAAGPPANAMLHDETISQIAEANKMSPAQVVLQWTLQTGHSMTPRIGGLGHTDPNLQHVKENRDVVFGDVPQLSAAEIQTITALKNEAKCWAVGVCPENM